MALLECSADRAAQAIFAHATQTPTRAMDSLQSSMLGALEHDQRKQQVNDAKMRAVKQKYDPSNLFCYASLSK